MQLKLKGYRKLISALIGVAGIVLTQYFGVPQVQTDNLLQVIADAMAALGSAWAIALVIWAQISAQGRVDEAEVASAQPAAKLPEFSNN